MSFPAYHVTLVMGIFVLLAAIVAADAITGVDKRASTITGKKYTKVFYFPVFIVSWFVIFLILLDIVEAIFC